MKVSILFALLGIAVGVHAEDSDFVCDVGDKLEAELADGITKLWCMLETASGTSVEIGRSIYIKGDIVIVEMNFDEEMRLHGLFRTRDESGVTTSQGYYERGSKIGDWLEWDEAANRVVEVTYTDRRDGE